MDLKEEDILGDAIQSHWYYAAKGRAVRALLAGLRVDQVLDVGAGSGVFSRMLLDEGIARRAVCVDPCYATEREEIHNGHPIAFVRETDTQATELVLMMDVLEHVDDDLALLRQYTANLNPGAKVLITVPAFQALWSGHDVFLEHRRRYTLAEVEALAARAGLEVVRGRYFFGLLFPAVAALRVLDRIRLQGGHIEAKSALKPASPFMNALLIAIHAVERALLFPVNRLAGLSAFCLAVKR